MLTRKSTTAVNGELFVNHFRSRSPPAAESIGALPLFGLLLRSPPGPPRCGRPLVLDMRPLPLPIGFLLSILLTKSVMELPGLNLPSFWRPGPPLPLLPRPLIEPPRPRLLPSISELYPRSFLLVIDKLCIEPIVVPWILRSC